MNILLWVLQVLLALWNLIGGSFVAVHYGELKAPWAGALPGPFWIAYGVLQFVFALGLLWRQLTGIAAIVLALLSLLGCALFAKYAGFPGCLWGVVPALLTAFVAYGRFKLRPF